MLIALLEILVILHHVWNIRKFTQHKVINTIIDKIILMSLVDGLPTVNVIFDILMVLQLLADRICGWGLLR